MLPHCCFPVCSDVGVYYINLKVCCLTVVSFPVCSGMGICYINLKVCYLTVVSLYVVMWGYVTLI